MAFLVILVLFTYEVIIFLMRILGMRILGMVILGLGILRLTSLGQMSFRTVLNKTGKLRINVKFHP